MKLNEHGKEKVAQFLKECTAKRKEILDARKDTGSQKIPTVEDIIDEVKAWGFDEDGDWFNCEPVTDNYDSDYPLSLNKDEDFEVL